MDISSLCIRFTDFNKLITMFPDKINQILLYIWLFPVSTVQTTNSLLSESNFHSPWGTSRLKSMLVNENFHSSWRADKYNFPALSVLWFHNETIHDLVYNISSMRLYRTEPFSSLGLYSTTSSMRLECCIQNETIQPCLLNVTIQHWVYTALSLQWDYTGPSL